MQQVLSVCTQRDKPGITRLVDTMEKNGLVVRMPDQADRRVNLIFLTEKARQLCQPLIEQVLLSLTEATSQVEPQQLAVCREVLAQVCANLMV